MNLVLEKVLSAFAEIGIQPQAATSEAAERPQPQMVDSET